MSLVDLDDAKTFYKIISRGHQKASPLELFYKSTRNSQRCAILSNMSLPRIKLLERVAVKTKQGSILRHTALMIAEEDSVYFWGDSKDWVGTGVVVSADIHTSPMIHQETTYTANIYKDRIAPEWRKADNNESYEEKNGMLTLRVEEVEGHSEEGKKFDTQLLVNYVMQHKSLSPASEIPVHVAREHLGRRLETLILPDNIKNMMDRLR